MILLHDFVIASADEKEEHEKYSGGTFDGRKFQFYKDRERDTFNINLISTDGRKFYLRSYRSRPDLFKGKRMKVRISSNTREWEWIEKEMTTTELKIK
jgi:hypothetical protein